MTPAVFTLLALAGGVGAACRFLFDTAVRGRIGDRFPWSTVLINLSGSLLLGLLTGLGTTVLPVDAAAVLGGGLLGGWTTFSTASIETARLLQQGRIAASLLNGPGVLVAATALAAAGLLLGRAV